MNDNRHLEFRRLWHGFEYFQSYLQYFQSVSLYNWENGHMFFKADTFLGINWIKLTADNGK